MENKDIKNTAFTPPKERFIYRLRFTKGDAVKFIGHLDIVRIFQRAIKRAELPISYSKGFNPHQLLSFAHPLSIGTTSTGEYGDFEMNCFIESQTIKDRLNSALPEGIFIMSVQRLWNGAKNVMASLEAASYEVLLDDEILPKTLESSLLDFMSQKEIIVLKKTKNSEKETDIKEDIIDIKNISEDEKAKLFLFISSGSRRNLKAELVISSFYNFLKKPFDRYKIKYKRVELYRFENEKYISLGRECQ